MQIFLKINNKGRNSMKKITIPTGSVEADLVYKVIGDRRIELTFLPPYKKKYDKAPLYFIIPGGGWHMEKREDMINFSLRSVEKLRHVEKDDSFEIRS